MESWRYPMGAVHDAAILAQFNRPGLNTPQHGHFPPQSYFARFPTRRGRITKKRLCQSLPNGGFSELSHYLCFRVTNRYLGERGTITMDFDFARADCHCYNRERGDPNNLKYLCHQSSVFDCVDGRLRRISASNEPPSDQ